MDNESLINTNIEDENQESDLEKECSICLETCTTHGIHMATRIKCGHIFGYICICEWINTAFSCPICKCPNTKDQLIRLRQHVRTNNDSPSTSEVDEASSSLRRQTARGMGPADRSRSPPDARLAADERLRENAGATRSHDSRGLDHGTAASCSQRTKNE